MLAYTGYLQRTLVYLYGIHDIASIPIIGPGGGSIVERIFFGSKQPLCIGWGPLLNLQTVNFMIVANVLSEGVFLHVWEFPTFLWKIS